MRTIQRSAAFAVFDMAAGRCGFGKNSIANFAIFRCHGLNRKLLDDDVALIERKVNAYIFPVKTGVGVAKPATWGQFGDPDAVVVQGAARREETTTNR